MTSWSYSAYSSAVQCLQKYKLCFIDKVVPNVPDSGDLAFGSALHSAINAILTGEDGKEVFEIYWESYREKEVKYGRFGWEALAGLGAEFCRKFAKLHAPKYQIHTAEVRLYGEYKGVKLEGTVDFLGQYSGRTSLRDFKTSGYQYDKSKVLTALQLNLYAYLARSNFPDLNLETLGYTVFNKGTGSIQDLTWDYSESENYNMLDNLIDYCTMVDKQTHFAKNPNACQMGSIKCQYFENCWGKKDE